MDLSEILTPMWRFWTCGAWMIATPPKTSEKLSQNMSHVALLGGETTGSGRNYVDPETRLGAWMIATPPNSSEKLSQNMSHMALLGGETTGTARDCLGLSENRTSMWRC